ncbi:gamma-glutamyl-gamma-aminobutyrate hydrolase family protein [Pseudohaliea rubra]|uniref:gamma-glutamyl-gamma-aminobutyrate hydrolase family protein n=1 Tax=Pseudohaliea rubra TaxID=475795 RepID=UPI001F16F350|nr:type 1 glutamine amidotransferase [Pseudohaliea rubra]
MTGTARRYASAWWCTRVALALCGARAVRISLRHQQSLEDIDGLVIGGGNDIAPEHYGGVLEGAVRIDAARDALELRWVRRALEHRLPLLGICRGAQLINVVLGGNLHGDIRALRRRTRNRGSLLPTKRVDLEHGSQLAAVTHRKRLRVNSLHHQAVDRPGEELAITGRDLDGLVQGVEHRERAILGVQWHPEYLLYLSAQRALFRWLVRAALERRG